MIQTMDLTLNILDMDVEDAQLILNLITRLGYASDDYVFTAEEINDDSN